MPRTRARTTRRVSGRTRGIGLVLGESKSTVLTYKSKNGRLCPACGRTISEKTDGSLRKHKKYKKSLYDCPGF